MNAFAVERWQMRLCRLNDYELEIHSLQKEQKINEVS